MGKHEAGTPKFIANKIKAKGLQKLRWYCQMCAKQCRDENGFKCHMMSESHQRQLLLFADNSSKYIDEFSREFEEGYLELLKRQFGTKRVFANRVYQDYIACRDHLHMNSTQWETLTEFVKFLGREGKCVVDETEKGWFVQYVDRDPEAIAQQEAMAKKEKMDKDDDEKLMDFIGKQIERGKVETATPVYTELVRENEEEKIAIDLKLNAVKKTERPETSNPFKEPKREDTRKKADKRKASALDEVMQEEERKKERANRRDNWLTEGIVVKVVTKSLGDKFYKQKAVITEVHDKYGATVTMLGSGTKVRLDQAHLETVIPTVGRRVKIVNGAYRGSEALMKGLNEKSFSVSLEIASGLLKGRQLENVAYEDVSKLHQAS